MQNANYTRQGTQLTFVFLTASACIYPTAHTNTQCRTSASYTLYHTSHF